MTRLIDHSGKYIKGRKFVVVREGAAIIGLQSIAPGVWQPCRRELAVGDMLTCDGASQTLGDGVPVVKWLGPNGEYICEDAEFKPSIGDMWNSLPNSEYIQQWNA